MKIDFVSDVACPWCAVGLYSLLQALDRVAGEIDVDLHFEPFELNPSMAPEGEEAQMHLSRKYGLSAAQLAHNRQTLVERGAPWASTSARARACGTPSMRIGCCIGRG
jgi:predicted DsbA family dithiol-disulfide isomerase